VAMFLAPGSGQTRDTGKGDIDRVGGEIIVPICPCNPDQTGRQEPTDIQVHVPFSRGCYFCRDSIRGR
jgi:hypothetical protein